MDRAETFYALVSPFFQRFPHYTLIDCCAGDGKAGVEFDKDTNLDRIIFVDVKEPNKFRRNVSDLQTPFEQSLDGISGVSVDGFLVFIAIHACGILTDEILEKAVSLSSALAVMPCCYNQNMKRYDLKNLPDKRKLVYESEKDYYDAFRLQYLSENGYSAFLRTISCKITSMNNVLIGIPCE